MHRAQRLVHEFNVATGQVRGDTIALRDVALRARLLREEAGEAADALEAGDLEKTVDGINDTLYVAYGAADVLGFDTEPYFDEVHRTNMQKIGGPVDEGGKVLKPPGWKPPRIREMLSAGMGELLRDKKRIDLRGDFEHFADSAFRLLSSFSSHPVVDREWRETVDAWRVRELYEEVTEIMDLLFSSDPEDRWKTRFEVGGRALRIAAHAFALADSVNASAPADAPKREG